MNRYLQASRIRLQQQVSTWQEAVQLAGNLLAADECATDAYVEAMVSMVESLGPYIVVAPGIALAHARPEDGALKEGISLVVLQTPVCFGNPDNDPVSIVLGIAATDSDKHLQLMSAIAESFQEKGFAESLITAESTDKVLEVK